jgi:hypothetical protein
MMTIEQGTLPGMKPSEIQRLQLETLVGAESPILVMCDRDVSSVVSEEFPEHINDHLALAVTNQLIQRVHQIRYDSVRFGYEDSRSLSNH